MNVFLTVILILLAILASEHALLDAGDRDVAEPAPLGMALRRPRPARTGRTGRLEPSPSSCSCPASLPLPERPEAGDRDRATDSAMPPATAAASPEPEEQAGSAKERC
mmetsp:Transcript_17303/g.46982  ORF Transcript_17303/g.46982 Transcript_17303/m.46982 type:complete len:108 (-) Transcript_17303:58-381(-)